MIPVALLQRYSFPSGLYSSELCGVHELRGGEMAALSLKQATYSTFDHSDMASMAVEPFKPSLQVSAALARLCDAAGDCAISEQEARELFEMYDEDGSGLIEKKEFDKMYRHLARHLIEKATETGLPFESIRVLRGKVFDPIEVYNATEAIFQQFAHNPPGRFYACYIDFDGFHRLVTELAQRDFIHTPQLHELAKTSRGEELEQPVSPINPFSFELLSEKEGYEPLDSEGL
eukprot:TRINITY_DN9234_c0_g1_i2.p1 TRINITY_DN9234_c0_g1~~TRINITY_DN9234_c0_g1_i2.p1  ORF type:complete len:232 (-),score=64.94 TRINITY_DN9234_c0_g1_i2:94-789(-)